MILLEFAVFFSAVYVGYLIRFIELENLFFDYTHLTTALFFSFTLLVSFTGMGLYRRSNSWGKAGLQLRVLAAFALGALVMTLYFYSFPDFFAGRGVFGFALIFSLLGVIILRYLFYKYSNHRDLGRRVLVLGVGENARKIVELEEEGRNLNLNVVGCIRMGEEECHIGATKLVETKTSLNEYAIINDIDEVVVAPDERRCGLPVDEILDCKMNGFDVVDFLTFFEREAGLIKVDSLHPSWMVFSDGFRVGNLRHVAKRVFDIGASVMLLAVAWPVMLVTAAAIWIESGGKGPIFYSQVRVGANWELFKIIKFRSMRTDAEKDGRAQVATLNDSRITRVGAIIRKTRIDEFPQLFNVLKGQMSFVGPRPERPEFVEKFAETIPYYSERHRVKPGITGWAQLCYPYGEGEKDALEKLQYDLYYLKNYSLFLDMMIILQTTEVILWGKGAR